MKKGKKIYRKKQEDFQDEDLLDENNNSNSSVMPSKVECLCGRLISIESVRQHFQGSFHKKFYFEKELEEEFYEYTTTLKSEFEQIESDYSEALSLSHGMNYSSIKATIIQYYKNVKPKLYQIQKRLAFKNTLLSYIHELWPGKKFLSCIFSISQLFSKMLKFIYLEVQ